MSPILTNISIIQVFRKFLEAMSSHDLHDDFEFVVRSVISEIRVLLQEMSMNAAIRESGDFADFLSVILEIGSDKPRFRKHIELLMDYVINNISSLLSLSIPIEKAIEKENADANKKIGHDSLTTIPILLDKIYKVYERDRKTSPVS